MRMHRILVAVLAVALIGFVSSPAEAAKPRRDVILKAYEVGTSNNFIMKGRIEPSYKRGKVILQQKINRGGWKAYKTVRTNAQSKFKTNIASLKRSGTVCYRTVVPGNKKYRKTITATMKGKLRICIKTTRF